ncbi:Hint domain-containing protein [Maritimibacter sp. UBA3975]|uniref:Hint domain-containing protein n=1 Tax=Maritimibacter sp. UBA3975 TaxID=1946833 RepID=UPI000C0919CF|nr:Hint domain-containing protein [Maritimibacter sp. UBA3975]MAM61741.1 hypothetical protein [Maritimibacter sp.]|tara:strand:+ start:6857 stop:7876 length:1020 start_codon:yes stop_codon:yes gene_type:complete
MANDSLYYLPVRQLMVYPADAFRVTHGVNEGDSISDADEMVPDDVYELAGAARPTNIALVMDENGGFALGGNTGLGTPGAPVFLDSLITLMSADGATVDALVFVAVDPGTGAIDEIYLHPLGLLPPRVPFTLVTIDREGGQKRLAESATVSFSRGTHITMANGRQVPVEELQPGDRVLTRDSGAQEVRWVGVQTVRAEGPFAPIRIKAGALNNLGDLVVSPNHRLFIYQRISALGAGQRELLVKAGLLVNGTTVTQTPGGFVDYVQVLFDQHEIIYAEGIAAESLFADTATRATLPDAVAERLRARPPKEATLDAFELREKDLLRRGDAVEMLRRISAN